MGEAPLQDPEDSRCARGTSEDYLNCCQRGYLVRSLPVRDHAAKSKKTYRSSANQSQAVLAQISRDSRDLKATSSSVDERLAEIQHSILQTRHEVFFQTDVVKRLLQSATTNDYFQGKLIDPQVTYSALPTRGFLETAMSIDNSPNDFLSKVVEIEPDSAKTLCPDDEVEPTPDSYAESAYYYLSKCKAFSKPISPLECSPNFLPETYTVDQRLSSNYLVVTTSYEEFSSDSQRTNIYRLFLQIAPRQWRKLIVTLKISRSSVFWDVTRIAKRGFNTRPSYNIAMPSIPTTLLSQFQDCFSEMEDLVEDAHVRVSLCKREGFQTDQLHRRDFRVDPFAADSKAIIASRTLLAFLDDLGCPRYFENEVTQIAMVEPPDRFAACVDGMLVYETKFAHPSPTYEAIYNIQLLHCLKGVAGFVTFMGIVVDRSGKHLKSYLVKFPRTKWSILTDKLGQDPPVPWRRREKWARQLIEGVRDVHSRGFVVGTLFRAQVRILVDDSDRLEFFRFEKKYIMGYCLGSYYPPEALHYRNAPPSMEQTNCPDLTPKFDIFHLGALLWLIAENRPRELPSLVCMREGCHTNNTRCDESHVDPIALPRLPDSIPKYYRDIIDLCRAADPNDRPAAWRLLDLFLKGDSDNLSAATFQPKPPKLEEFDISSLRDSFDVVVDCDYCHMPVIDGDRNVVYFHCNICREGDFDICRSCYEKGLHCNEQDHLLVEVEKTRTSIVTVKYHSRVKEAGRRDSIEI